MVLNGLIVMTFCFEFLHRDIRTEHIFSLHSTINCRP